MTHKCTECEKVGIENKVIAKGFCWKHYRRFLRYGNTETVNAKGSKSDREIPSRCFDGCENDNGIKICNTCRMKSLYEERRELGLCHSCGGVREETAKQCKPCRDKVNKRKSALRESRRNK